MSLKGRLWPARDGKQQISGSLVCFEDHLCCVKVMFLFLVLFCFVLFFSNTPGRQTGFQTISGDDMAVPWFFMAAVWA